MKDSIDVASAAGNFLILLDEQPASIEPHEDLLTAAGIRFKVYSNIEDLLSDLSEFEPVRVAGLCLDFMLPVPLNVQLDGPVAERGGAWLFKEVIKNVHNQYLPKRMSEGISRKPVAFLTNYIKDSFLLDLVKAEVKSDGRLELFKKSNDQKRKFLAWAKCCMGESELLSDFEDSLLAVISLGRVLSLSLEEELQLLGADPRNFRLWDSLMASTKVVGVEETFLKFNPPDRAIAVRELVGRWDAVTTYISGVVALYGGSIEKAAVDMGFPIDHFSGRSARAILIESSLSELVLLQQYFERRWGRQ